MNSLAVRLVLVALGAAVAVSLVTRARRGGEVKQVEVATVEARVISPTILASGSLIYQTEIRIMSEVMGRVKELYVKEGRAGARRVIMLLRLDPATVQAQVDRLEAGLQQSKLSIERARVSMQIQPKPSGSGISSCAKPV